jgi:hypothetical protein
MDSLPKTTKARTANAVRASNEELDRMAEQGNDV